MDHVINGFASFKKQVFPRHQELFSELAQGQRPEVLFITCSDSRVDPNMVTQSNPGDLFIIRNAGNIVPPHGGPAGGVTASIEYAVAVLNVAHIIICGHTHCSAMHGAISPEALKDLPHVRDWLELSRAAVEVVKHTHEGPLDASHLRAITEQNVLAQLMHLRTHPLVAARVATKRLFLHGWMYEIESGDLLAFDEQAQRFGPLAEVYARVMGRESAAAGAVE